MVGEVQRWRGLRMRRIGSCILGKTEGSMAATLQAIQSYWRMCPNPRDNESWTSAPANIMMCSTTFGAVRQRIFAFAMYIYSFTGRRNDTLLDEPCHIPYPRTRSRTRRRKSRATWGSPRSFLNAWVIYFRRVVRWKQVLDMRP